MIFPDWSMENSSCTTKKSGENKMMKVSWTPDEDANLLALIESHGTLSWTVIASKLMIRTGKQCRERYHNHLQPNIKKGDWTPEEDNIIVMMHQKIGNQWAKITKLLPGRTNNAVKNRWYSAHAAKTMGGTSDVKAVSHAISKSGARKSAAKGPVVPKLNLTAPMSMELDSSSQQAHCFSFLDGGPGLKSPGRSAVCTSTKEFHERQPQLQDLQLFTHDHGSHDHEMTDSSRSSVLSGRMSSRGHANLRVDVGDEVFEFLAEKDEGDLDDDCDGLYLFGFDGEESAMQTQRSDGASSEAETSFLWAWTSNLTPSPPLLSPSKGHTNEYGLEASAAALHTFTRLRSLPDFGENVSSPASSGAVTSDDDGAFGEDSSPEGPGPEGDEGGGDWACVDLEALWSARSSATDDGENHNVNFAGAGGDAAAAGAAAASAGSNVVTAGVDLKVSVEPHCEMHSQSKSKGKGRSKGTLLGAIKNIDISTSPLSPRRTPRTPRLVDAAKKQRM